MENDAKREEALAFLVGHDTGVLATVSEGNPRARLVYYTCDDAFNIYFVTLASTRKAADLAQNPRVAFVVSETEVPRTIQVEGTATDLTDTAELDPLLKDFVDRLMKHQPYGIPLGRLDTAAIKFFKITPSWVRWGDFTFGQGTDAVLSEINPSETA